MESESQTETLQEIKLQFVHALHVSSDGSRVSEDTATAPSFIRSATYNSIKSHLKLNLSREGPGTVEITSWELLCNKNKILCVKLQGWNFFAALNHRHPFDETFVMNLNCSLADETSKNFFRIRYEFKVRN